MQPKAALDACGFVLGTLVLFEDARLAPYRPVHVGEVALGQAVLLRRQACARQVATVTMDALCSETEDPRRVRL
jgi:hypothetical protein